MREEDQLSHPGFLRLDDFLPRTGIKKSRWYELRDQRLVPQAYEHPLAPGAKVYKVSEIQKLLVRLEEEMDKKAGIGGAA